MATPQFHATGRPDSIQCDFDGSILANKGDLLFYDGDDVKPASSQADGGSKAANQRSFAPRFIGVAGDTRLAADTGALTDFPVWPEVVATFDCASATFEVGNLVAVDEDSGGTFLEDQKLIKTTDPSLAIGEVIKQYAAATTRVKVHLKARFLNGGGPAVPHVIAAQQALTDAGAITLTEEYTAWSTTGAAAGTLADGLYVGQRKKIRMVADVGDATLTPVSLNGGTTITFADVGDETELVWDGSGWTAVYLGNAADGATAPVLA